MRLLFLASAAIATAAAVPAAASSSRDSRKFPAWTEAPAGAASSTSRALAPPAALPAVPAALSGAAAQRALPFVTPGIASTLRQDDARVAAVAYRLALAGRALCAESYPLTGMLLHHLAEYAPAERRQILRRTAIDRGPGVLTVLDGSPAARAGLIAGDVLLAVNGRAFPAVSAVAAERKQKKMRLRIEATEAQLESDLRNGPAELRVLRDGRELTLMLDPVPGCIGRVRLARSTQTNAFSLRGYVIMTTKMLAYLRSDDELAVVLGHELGHSILRHEGMRSEEGLFESLGIKPSNIWRREEQADRFGLRLMAAAGFDLDAAIPFWNRYLGEFDWFPQIIRSHPSRGSRERIAREEIAAIRAEAAATPPVRPGS